jgi:hypothetical protein
VRDVDTARLLTRVQDTGVCWIGGTTWDARPAVRLSVSNWRTDEDDIERAVASITDAISAVRTTRPYGGRRLRS